jgi:hypothetical protein
MIVLGKVWCSPVFSGFPGWSRASSLWVGTGLVNETIVLLTAIPKNLASAILSYDGGNKCWWSRLRIEGVGLRGKESSMFLTTPAWLGDRGREARNKLYFKCLRPSLFLQQCNRFSWFFFYFLNALGKFLENFNVYITRHMHI